MALRKLERRNYGGKSPVSIKYQNLHTLKEGLILLYQSIIETRRIIHLYGSAHFTIPLKCHFDFLLLLSDDILTILKNRKSISLVSQNLYY